MENGPEVGKMYRLKTGKAKGIVVSVDCLKRTAVLKTASTGKLWNYPVAWNHLELVPEK